MSQEAPARYVFREGDHALVFDRKGRRYMFKLEGGKSFHTHLGNFGHDDLIGQPEGTRVQTNRAHAILAFKPTMADFTRLMPRIATIVYPKDLGAIITLGDIFPGARVVEAGSGSGAVTIALLRAVGTEGRVFSYDLRADMLERASTNVAAPSAPLSTYRRTTRYSVSDARPPSTMAMRLRCLGWRPMAPSITLSTIKVTTAQ